MKKQGFSANPDLHFLIFKDLVPADLVKAVESVYHTTGIPSHYFDTPGKYAIVAHDVIYFDAHGRRHRVPRGTISDGGTIPRILRASVGAPFSSPYLLAYIIHDHYAQHSRDIADKRDRKNLRLHADQLLYEMVIYLGAGWIKRHALYRGVRIGAMFEK